VANATADPTQNFDVRVHWYFLFFSRWLNARIRPDRVTRNRPKGQAALSTLLKLWPGGHGIYTECVCNKDFLRKSDHAVKIFLSFWLICGAFFTG